MPHPHIHFATSEDQQKRFARYHSQGRFRRIVPRVYVDAELQNVDQSLRRNILSILEFTHPGSVLAYRSAITLRADDDRVWLLDERRPGSARRRQIGPVTVRMLGGNTETGVEAVLPQLRRMTLERVILESLNATRRYRGQEKFLTREECEIALIKVLRGGESALNDLRDRAHSIAGPLECERGFEELSALISSLLNTSDAKGLLVTESGRAVARKEAFDSDSVERCTALRDYLLAQELPCYTRDYQKAAWDHVSFFESYFSNYIEGTEMTVREAEDVVFQSRDVPNRSGDSHDVRACYQICSDYGEMAVTPDSPEQLLGLLQYRHGILMGGRPEHSPGEFKTWENRAGNTAFVGPLQVKGTLRRGFELYDALPNGMARALFVHFLITDVHPMSDGNGRLARLMANAELVSDGQAKILVPTVARDDYLNGQRLATREQNFRVMCKVLVELHGYSSALPVGLYDDLLQKLETDRAFALPDEGLPIFSRARMPYRFEPLDPGRNAG